MARFPRADHFNSTEPPRWLLKALILAALVAMGAVVTWNAVGALSGLLIMLLCALFLSLAIEPPVNWLVQHGWRRGLATGAVILIVLGLVVALITVFGQMFIQQVVDLIEDIPSLYANVAEWVNNTFNTDLEEQNKAIANFINQFGSNIAGQAFGITTSLFSGVITVLGVGLIMFYLTARGPQFRATVCGLLPPRMQHMVLQLWAVAQNRIAGYINSRLILALISALATWAFLQVIGIPFAVPLGMFTGLVSQFIPTVGTYIGGALPVLFGLLQSPGKGIAVLVFIIAYQQVENLWFSPKISARAMDINPAVAFISVIGMGALLGPIGAFLSMPIVATAQAIISTYIRRYDLIDDELLTQDKTRDSSGSGGRAKPEESVDSQESDGSTNGDNTADGDDSTDDNKTSDEADGSSVIERTTH